MGEGRLRASRREFYSSFQPPFHPILAAEKVAYEVFYIFLRRDTGGVEPEPVPGPQARKGEALEAVLPGQVRENPDDRGAHRGPHEGDEGMMRVSTTSVSQALKRLGLPLLFLPAAEREEEEKRAHWRGRVGRLAPRHLVLAGECATHTSVTHLRARAPRGERTHSAEEPRQEHDAAGEHDSVEGRGAVVSRTTKVVLESYVEQVLARPRSDQGR